MGRAIKTSLMLFALALAAAGPARGAAQQPNAGTIDAHLGAGYEDLRNNRYDSAAREFRAALAVDPKLVMQARFPLAVALFELHQPDEARREFEAVRQDAGDQPGVEYYLGRIDLAQGNAQAAVQELTRASAKPPFPDTAYYLGSAYLKQHDTTSAEKWLLQAAELEPNDPLPEYALGQLYSETGRKPQAGRALAKSEELRERQAEVDRLRVECTKQLEQGPLAEARQVCNRLYDRDDFEKLTILGTLYGQRGDYVDALAPLQRAAEIKPALPQTQYNLALNYVRLDRYPEAKQALAKAVERWPDLFPIASLWGGVLYKLGDEPAAYAALDHAHQLNPQDDETAGLLYDAAMRLGQQSLVNKQYAESLKYLQRAAELLPRSPEPHRLAAQVYEATGQKSEAERERRQADAASSGSSD